MLNPSFRKLLMTALREFAAHGYRNELDLQDWLRRIHSALERELPTDAFVRNEMAGTLNRIFTRDVVRGGVQRRVPGVQRYTLDRVSPLLRAELDRRIFAGVDLIRLNRHSAVQKTLQRFTGWVSSMPPGGSRTADVREIAKELAKPISQLKYERRRVAIDQGHKLSAAVAHVVAKQEGAIAAIWHDRGEDDRGYDARPEHLARSGTLFLIRDSWAAEQGLIARKGAAYSDTIEQPAELPFCSCWFEYVSSPRALPEALLSTKGRAWVSGVRHDSLADPAMREVIAAGVRCAIETAAGETRHGIGKDGRPWRSLMPFDYGFIRRTLGADGDEIDCYVGPNPESNSVVLIDQLDADTGDFDEHKVMLGFDGTRDALEAYVSAFGDGRAPQRLGDVRVMNAMEFREWLRSAAAAVA